MNKYIKQTALLALSALLMTACDEEYIMDDLQTESTVVIEGLVTNLPGRQFVKVSRSGDFYASGKTERITNATVQVTDNAGNTFLYAHNPNGHADSVGYYKPTVPFVGQVGRTYNLTVQADGETFIASDEMFHINPIEELEFRVDDDQVDEPEDEDFPNRIYEVLMTVEEPQETRDYYLFRTYRNGERIWAESSEEDPEIYVTDDVLVGGEINDIAIPGYFENGEVAGAEIYSLSRPVFIYYRDLSKILANDGGMFDPPPANPRSNISNNAYGVFQASAISYDEIRVEAAE
ncbi:DUF4249 domain-containing protein [Parachryseolinea silvisoli]|jgi:hypothetical protein|uniref:DUF4249 domain-containing protein n=1 Tax=Parachryseolinea silvisoli TaxID=2873601 RepID=UPI002265A2B3|nr:DUF4249 domain-containing protein [Parachryseolinea silvisoli]MCD9014011.1 DUF4249 domain-containing protein [Parachryseolinea silvisoli]